MGKGKGKGKISASKGKGKVTDSSLDVHKYLVSVFFSDTPTLSFPSSPYSPCSLCIQTIERSPPTSDEDTSTSTPASSVTDCESSSSSSTTEDNVNSEWWQEYYYDGEDEDDTMSIPSDLERYFELADDWEHHNISTKDTKAYRKRFVSSLQPTTVARTATVTWVGQHLICFYSKALKGPKLRVRVNGPRHNKALEKESIIQDQYKQEKENAAVRCALTRSTSTPHSHITTASSSSSRSSKNSRVHACGLTTAQLNDIQNRELTPEDYELLLALDASVPKKTLTLSTINNLAPITHPSSQELPSSNCVICFCEFEQGCAVRTLPCGHPFHSDCIVNWLTNSSVNCPVDNLPLS